MTQEKSPMESRNLCGKKRCEIQKFTRGFTLTGKAGRQNAAGRLNINKNAYSALNAASGWSKTLSWMFSQRSFTSALMN